MNLFRSISVLGENEDHDATIIDRLNDSARPFRTWRNIARGNPAPDAIRFKLRAGGIRDRLVLMRVADEYVECHGAPSLLNSRPQANLLTKVVPSHCRCFERKMRDCLRLCAERFDLRLGGGPLIESLWALARGKPEQP